MLNQQIYSNSMLTKRLSEKDILIHSLAHDLIEASSCIESWSEGIGEYYKFKDIAQSALDSITNKGEKE